MFTNSLIPKTTSMCSSGLKFERSIIKENQFKKSGFEALSMLKSCHMLNNNIKYFSSKCHHKNIYQDHYYNLNNSCNFGSNSFCGIDQTRKSKIFNKVIGWSSLNISNQLIGTSRRQYSILNNNLKFDQNSLDNFINSDFDLNNLEPLGQFGSFEKLCIKTRELLSQGKYQEALELSKEIISLNPTHPSGLLSCGICHFELGNIEMAIEAFESLVKSTPEFPDAHFLLARAYYKIKDSRSFKHHLKKVLELDDRHVGANMALGMENFNSLNYKQAIYFLKKASVIDPQNVDALLFLGRAQLVSDECAIETFENCLAIESNNMIAKLGLAEAQLQENQLGPCLDTIEEYMQTSDTKSAIAYIIKAAAQSRLRYKKIEDYPRVSTKEDYREVANEDLDDFIQTLEEGLCVLPENLDILLNLCEAYLRSGINLNRVGEILEQIYTLLKAIDDNEFEKLKKSYPYTAYKAQYLKLIGNEEHSKKLLIYAKQYQEDKALDLIHSGNVSMAHNLLKGGEFYGFESNEIISSCLICTGRFQEALEYAEKAAPSVARDSLLCDCYLGLRDYNKCIHHFNYVEATKVPETQNMIDLKKAEISITFKVDIDQAEEILNRLGQTISDEPILKDLKIKLDQIKSTKLLE